MQKQIEFNPRPQGARKKLFRSTQGASFKEATVYGYATSSDQTKIFYSVEGKGPPIVFCYGLVCSSLHWTYQIEHLKHNYQTIWFDYRGHNNSEKPSNEKAFSIEHLSQDLLAVIDALGVAECVVVGHSMGVNVAIEFAKRHPHRVKGLILANGTPQRPLDHILGTNILTSIVGVMKSMHQKNHKLFSVFWNLQKKNPLLKAAVAWAGFNRHLSASSDIQLYIKQVIDTDPHVFFTLLEEYQKYDAVSWLHTIQQPVLILAGEKDKITPIDRQELIYQLLPNAQFEVLKHGSHCTQLDLPELVNFKIDEFLEQLNY